MECFKSLQNNALLLGCFASANLIPAVASTEIELSLQPDMGAESISSMILDMVWDQSLHFLPLTSRILSANAEVFFTVDGVHSLSSFRYTNKRLPLLPASMIIWQGGLAIALQAYNDTIIIEAMMLKALAGNLNAWMIFSLNGLGKGN